jgi:hypothetical protein
MNREEAYIYKKEVDWSALHYGINIPVSIQVLFQQKINSFLRKGEFKGINLILEDKTYKTKLINQSFDKNKYPTHKDILQIRYTPKSEIAGKMREIFHGSYKYLKAEKSKLVNRRLPLRVPEEMREYIVLYTTQFGDTFFMDSITNSDRKIIKSYASNISEEDFELSIDYNKIDSSARIENKPQIVKIRKLDKAIGETLKLLYKNQCQICGYNFSEKYHVSIVESHHIEFFVRSLNNNADNIIIICPNHHRIIHKTNPLFDRNNLSFAYPNGLIECIKLNRHLERIGN